VIGIPKQSSAFLNQFGAKFGAHRIDDLSALSVKDCKIGKLPSAFGRTFSRSNRCINFFGSRCRFDDCSFDVGCRRKQYVDQVI